MTVYGLWLPSGRQHEPASALFMIIRGSFMAIYVKNKSVEYRPEANCQSSCKRRRGMIASVLGLAERSALTTAETKFAGRKGKASFSFTKEL